MPMPILGGDIHTHAPAPTSSTDFIMCAFVLRKRSTNSLGRGHRYERHSPCTTLLFVYIISTFIIVINIIIIINFPQSSLHRCCRVAYSGGAFCLILTRFSCLVAFVLYYYIILYYVI